MAKKSSTLLALLFIFNPILLLFFQNCSSIPKHDLAKHPKPAERVSHQVDHGP